MSAERGELGDAGRWLRDVQLRGHEREVSGGSVPPAPQVNFTPATGQYIRLRALSEIHGNPWTAVAEIIIRGR